MADRTCFVDIEKSECTFLMHIKNYFIESNEKRIKNTTYLFKWRGEREKNKEIKSELEGLK